MPPKFIKGLQGDRISFLRKFGQGLGFTLVDAVEKFAAAVILKGHIQVGCTTPFSSSRIEARIELPMDHYSTTHTGAQGDAN